jgi:hypothetical protein
VAGCCAPADIVADSNSADEVSSSLSVVMVFSL